MKKFKLAIIGLGYVGLPLAVEFGKKYETIGYDIDVNRVNELNKGTDSTLEIDEKSLKSILNNKLFSITNEISKIKNCNIYIITVPTPIDEFNNPVLSPLLSASKLVGKMLNKNDIVIYESTVYPGCTEEDCVPVLEKESGLKFNIDFYCGYSPERINPGDKKHTVTKILKVTSGSNKKTADIVNNLYSSIITAGTYQASSIKVAEASKIIENSQRDINIAYVNELAKIFNLMGINTNEVLDAAATKWNFLKFQPGLVGGHCIGVDPYYLAQKAQKLGYNPEIILSGRRINDSMGSYVASSLVKKMIKADIKIKNSSVLILGIAFKENCPDFRNTKVIDIINYLKDLDVNLTIHDPWVDSQDIFNKHKINVVKNISHKRYDGIIIAVSHKIFFVLDIDSLKKESSVVYDVKGMFSNSLNASL